MGIRQVQPGERGVSAVIGTVLLIGIVTLVMAVLAAALLGVGLFDQQPDAELSYQEHTDKVVVGLTDVRDLSAGETEIKLEGEGSCGFWDGSGELEKGDVTTLESSDCPDSLEQGDVLQVIGGNVLLGTYELRGQYPDYGCTTFKSKFNNGNQIDVETGGIVSCDFTDPDGTELNNGLKVNNQTTVVGEVNVSKTSRIEVDGGKIIGDVETGKDADIKDDSVVDGTVSADESVYVRDSSKITGSVDAGDSVDVDQDATVNGPIDSSDYVALDERAFVGGAIESDDEVTLAKDAVVEGGVAADREVTIGNSAEIDGTVESGYDVSLEQDSLADSEVELTGSGRTLELSDGATISGTVSAADNDVTLKGDAKISGDVTGDTVTCKDSSTVEGTVTAGTNNGC
ncbi:polymer-forming cytoskeletal protein [Natrinema longum]|uniref:Polymer-forming cytoskeletal protein n=1 Tax=Natrinema longum TaxID=370324 RepID=A0A8A2UCS9_9EURY|nr:polymer-forming cytoskeletal protein [Natrinema longum]MBZ6496067.1 polymer-forming cytoskeletal protein [Natrinema longum]QSW86005.1 polymer-forming cytoskeletal protein [Natrinema longum]